MILPPGAIVNIAINPINDYILCNGQAVSRIDYAQLFDRIGTIFGSGDDTTTFNVPNLNKSFIRGSNDINFNTIKEPNYIKHSHEIHLNYGGAHSHYFRWTGVTSMKDGGSGYRVDMPFWYPKDRTENLHETDYGGYHNHTVTFQEAGVIDAQPECILMLFGITI